MTAKVFEAALGIGAPWSVGAVEFDEATKVLTVPVDFKPGTRFKVSGQKGLHPVHDTVVKTYRHLNFFQHECYLKVRTPRVKLGDGSVRLVEPDFAGRLSGFTLLFEALVLMLSQQMPFAAVARIVGESAYRCMQVCNRYVEMALEQADFSDVSSLAIDETSRARGHDYVTLAADAQARRVIFVTEGRDAKAVKALAADLAAHGCPPEQITSVSIDMSPAFIKGVSDQLPNAQITFDKFHVVGHANAAGTKPGASSSAPRSPSRACAGRCSRMSSASKRRPAQRCTGLITAPKLTRTARAWLYKEQLREALDRKQINVMRERLKHWCVCVMRSKVEAMKEVAALVRRHMDGIVAWAQTRQTNGFLEAINGLFQSAKRRARGFKRLSTIKTVIFLIAGKLDFQTFNPHARQPT
ncbi:transposase [Xanthomonas oryzae pv. oryzae KACC 10331]|uniref:Transposase n=1 Tax=Xanthomonas oryzae pv. oryzae (strain KACC10331 / KXO85) TaxID=291331 RepID=Q5GVU1_XANOR|nr:transposase [Xanthomonas oryzae pv. oryzae KACC 10331]